MATQQQRDKVAAKLSEALGILSELLATEDGFNDEIAGFSIGGPGANVSECVYRAAKLLEEAREGATGMR